MHECRHTFASLMIAAGVNAKALSVYMGHSNIGITMDHYGHLMPGNEDRGGWSARRVPAPRGVVSRDARPSVEIGASWVKSAPYLLRGHYPGVGGGQLAGVSGNAIGQWARRGYIHASQSTAIPKVYSYQDVAEAMVVHDLLDVGIKHREIMKAIKALERDGDWPLTHADLRAENVLSASPRLVAVESGTPRTTSRIGLATDRESRTPTKISAELRRGGWAVRRIPSLTHIEVDPDRLSGRPVIRGRRVAARDVAETAEEADGREALEEGYGLKAEEIDDARNWWREVRQLAA